MSYVGEVKKAKMVLQKVKDSEKINKAVEDMVYWVVRGAFVIGAFLFLEKLLAFSFDLQVNLGL